MRVGHLLFKPIHSAIALLILLIAWVDPISAQAPKGRTTADAPKPPLTYHGLIPGLSTADETRKALGDPIWEARWYAYKLLYESEGRPDLIDSIHLSGKEGVYASCEAASIPEGYESETAILAELKKPEYEVRMPTFTLLDYSAKGLRFILDRAGKTIGVAYVPRVRVAPRKSIDLRAMRQGPQPAPEKPADLMGLNAGAAEASITPVTSAWLNPLHQKDYNPHDDLFARVVVFEKGDLTVAVVGADLFVMSYTDIKPIIERLREKGVEHLILGMSHTHSGPDTIGVYGHYPAEYNRYVQDQVVQAVTDAMAALKPVKALKAASRELPMDGARVQGLIRNARNPGLMDPTFSVLQAIGEDDQAIATIVNFACHPEGLEKGVVELSADFPGYLCKTVRADGGGQAVFLNGALGGMISGDSKARTHEETEKMGVTFAAIAKELIAAAQPPAEFKFEATTTPVEIPMTNEKFLPLYETVRPLNEGRVVTEMTLFRLGEAEFITLPGEVLPEVSFEIQERMTGFPRILVGLANDQLGYILPAFDFRADEYEESMSQGPAAGPVIRDTAFQLLESNE